MTVFDESDEAAMATAAILATATRGTRSQLRMVSRRASRTTGRQFVMLQKSHMECDARCPQVKAQEAVFSVIEQKSRVCSKAARICGIFTQQGL